MALIALDAESLLGVGAQTLAEDALSDQPSAIEQLEAIAQYLRRHLHRGDVVLSIEPRWIIILAVVDEGGAEAITQRLRGALRKDLAGFVESAETLRLPFGFARYPADGQDVRALLAKATGAGETILSAAPGTEASHG